MNRYEDRDWPADMTTEQRRAQLDEARTVPGMVWLGDLSGMVLEGDLVSHRCGWTAPADGPYLSNMVVAALAGHDCRDYR